MLEQKQTRQYSREQLEKKKKFWERFTTNSLVTGSLLVLGSIIIIPPVMDNLSPKKSKEVVQYENAQETYNWLRNQRDNITPELPYENEAIQRFLDTNKERTKDLDDAIESASEEMNINFAKYNDYQSSCRHLSHKGLASGLGLVVVPFGLAYLGNRKEKKFNNLLKKQEASKKC